MTLRAVAAASFRAYHKWGKSLLPAVSSRSLCRFLNTGAFIGAAVPRQKCLDQTSQSMTRFTSSSRRTKFLPFNVLARNLGFSASMPRMEKLVVKVPTMGDSITEVRFRSVQLNDDPFQKSS
jgi:hypothetical protein